MKMKFDQPNQRVKQEKQREDYSKLSREQLLDKFQSSNWGNMKDEDRINLVQEMENRNAAQQGRAPALVVQSGSLGSYGSYNSLNNQMKINVSNFSSYEVLDTYVHESNHAYQHSCMANGAGYDQHMLNMMQAETARDENGALYNYAQQSPYYDMQCNELDSNNRALSFMMGEKSRYEKDAAYKSYISERFCHFQDVNTAITLQEENRRSLQKLQADEAFKRGDITKEQYKSLVENIQNTGFEDSAVKESFALETQLSEIHNGFVQEAENEAAGGCGNEPANSAGNNPGKTGGNESDGMEL